MSASSFTTDTQTETIGNSSTLAGERQGNIVHLPVERTSYVHEATRQSVIDKVIRKLDTDVEINSDKLPNPPLGVLPPMLQDFCRTAAFSAESNEAMVLAFLLPALAGAIGSSYQIEVKPGHREPSVIWTAIIGETGTSKSPTKNVVFEPIEAWTRQKAKEFRAAKSKHQEDLERWTRTPREERGEKPEPPILEQFKVNNTTIEALAELWEKNPRGVLLLADELLSFVGGMNQYKGGHGSDRQAALELWNCQPLTIARKSGTISIPRPALSLTGGIQPGVLHELAPKNRADGFIERFLMLFAKPEIKDVRRGAVDPAPLEEWSKLLHRLLDTCAIGPDTEIQTVRFDDRAQELFYDQVNLHRKLMRSFPAKAVGIARKIEAYAGRIALVMHLARYYSGESVNPLLADGRDVEAGWALARWFERHALLARGLMSLSDEDLVLQKVIRWMTKQGGEAALRDVMRSDVLGKHVSRIEVQAVMERLQECGLVTAEVNAADRRVIVYRLVA